MLRQSRNITVLSDSTTEEREDVELKRDVSEGGRDKRATVVSAAEHATGGI